MKFLVDNQLPRALALFLRERGVDCQHVIDIEMAEAKDTAIWEYACENDRVLISKDEDFLYLAKSSAAKARFIWVRLGNCRKKVLLGAVERLWSKIEARLESGDRIVELR